MIGNHNHDPEGSSGQWLFNDGPRELRLAAIEKIPELLNKLSEAATQMTAHVRNKLGEAQEVAEAIKLVANEGKATRSSSK